MKQITALLLFTLVLAVFPACSLAQFDAQMAENWLDLFAAEAAALAPVNDVLATADPARPGEYLHQYAFGSVAARTPTAPAAQDILRIELTADGVRDCRGLSVGQTLEAVLGGREIPASKTPLYVLSTQESGYGWSWAYVQAGSVYGVEYIAYSGDVLSMKEYTLTYVIENDVIIAIRMQMADATQALAQEGMQTAQEIAGRQQGEILAEENSRTAFEPADMTMSYRRVIGVPVEELIALIGEPQEIQVLPDGDGRLFVYAFCASELLFDEMTGVESVRSITCVMPGIIGPRGIQVNMDAREAAALFRCDNSVTSTGGVLYLAGEAQGIAPYGEVIPAGEEQYMLSYACVMENGETGMLHIGVSDGKVINWRLSMEQTEGAYGG